MSMPTEAYNKMMYDQKTKRLKDQANSRGKNAGQRARKANAQEILKTRPPTYAAMKRKKRAE